VDQSLAPWRHAARAGPTLCQQPLSIHCAARVTACSTHRLSPFRPLLCPSLWLSEVSMGLSCTTACTSCQEKCSRVLCYASISRSRAVLSAVHYLKERRHSLRGAPPQIRRDTVYRFEVQGLQERRKMLSKWVSCCTESMGWPSLSLPIGMRGKTHEHTPGTLDGCSCSVVAVCGTDGAFGRGLG
jgi:hypothetical protein